METTAEKFHRLADVWRAETAYISASNDQVAHPAFEDIVAWGLPWSPWYCASWKTGRDTGTAPCGESRGSIQSPHMIAAISTRWPKPGRDGLAAQGLRGVLLRIDAQGIEIQISAGDFGLSTTLTDTARLAQRYVRFRSIPTVEVRRSDPRQPRGRGPVHGC